MLTPWQLRRPSLALAATATALVAAFAGTQALRRAVAARTRALRDSEARYRALVDHAPEAIFVIRVNPDGSFVYEGGNPVTQTISGVRELEMRGRPLSDFLPATVAEQNVARYRRCIAEGAPIRFEYALPGRAGPRFWETTLVPVRDGSGRVARLVGAARDVTARRESEALVRQAQKMEAVGQLTGGVAHDFNNLLTIIVGALEGIARGAGEPARVERYARLALGAADRGTKLTQQLLAFSRRQTLQPKVVDVNASLAEFAPLAARAAGEAVRLRLEPWAAPALCRLDPSQFEAAILNLVVNARDALPSGGDIVLGTRPVPPEPGSPASGLRVEVWVADNGQGIPPEDLERVFEPFFTTKEVGKGTGLGLSMVYGFVRQSGGDVRITSRLGEGTRVALLLPSAAGAPPECPDGADHAVEPHGGEALLLVEDNADVRTVTAAVLAELGYRVHTASDAAEALALLRTQAAIDLLFTDVVMPGGASGLDLARAALRLRPGLKVLTTSGDLARAHDGDPGFATLAKPYKRADLARMIRRVLEGAA